MKYLLPFFFIIIASTITQLMNFIAIKNQVSDFYTIIKFSILMCIPLIIANTFFMLYYWNWSNQLSYIALLLIAFFVSLLMWFTIQWFFLWKQIHIHEIIWVIVMFLWLLIINKEKILQLYNTIN
jgi:hypothetical protein